jgi:hypothetical protein
VSLEAFVCFVGERPDNCACSCTVWLRRDFVLIKRRGEMQVSNTARISRAIPSGDKRVIDRPTRACRNSRILLRRRCYETTLR